MNSSHDSDRQGHPGEEDLELFLTEIADEEPAAGLRRHVEACGRCRRRVATLRSLHQALSAVPPLAPASGFAEAILTRVRIPVPWYRKLWNHVRERWLALGLLLGGLAIAAGAAGTWVAGRPWALDGMAEYALEQASAFFWSAVLAAARLLWRTGVPGGVIEVARSIEPMEAAGTLAALSLLSLAAAALMTKLLRAPRLRPGTARN